jgi:hypothetical protein
MLGRTWPILEKPSSASDQGASKEVGLGVIS